MSASDNSLAAAVAAAPPCSPHSFLVTLIPCLSSSFNVFLPVHDLNSSPGRGPSVLVLRSAPAHTIAAASRDATSIACNGWSTGNADAPATSVCAWGDGRRGDEEVQRTHILLGCLDSNPTAASKQPSCGKVVGVSVGTRKLGWERKGEGGKKNTCSIPSLLLPLL